MKYKVGDKVKLKSKEWLDEIGRQLKGMALKPEVYDIAGLECTICNIVDGGYIFDVSPMMWSENMIEGLVEEETKVGTVSNPIEPKSNANCLTQERVDALATKIDEELPSGNPYEWECPEGYQFVDENGNVINANKIVLEKKNEYPKTYCECKDILGLRDIDDTECGYYKIDLIDKLQMLLICRDAYWKLYGEEMGLGKPWSPDYDSGVNKYGIICMNGVVQKSNPTTNWERHLNKVLEFPTPEMRDAFKKNFDPDIEFCKELL